jgi:hypothetical protein
VNSKLFDEGNLGSRFNSLAFAFRRSEFWHTGRHIEFQRCGIKFA